MTRDPLATVRESQVMLKGAVVFPPTSTPSTVNRTRTTPTLSDALAEIVTFPLTTAPEAGAVRLTVGRVVSVDTLLTVTVMADDVATFPAASRATAARTCEPFDAVEVAQLVA